MSKRFVMIAALSATLGMAQVPSAPNTQPKPVNDPTNTNNITNDPTSPGGGNIAGGNSGFGTNPGAGITDQMREAADQIFATDVALQALTELELGKLVTAKASSEAVKSYAAQMTESNGKMNERLKRIAARGHVTIPAALDSKHQARVDKLAKISGDEFDRAFARDQVQSGERNLRSFEQQIQNGSDPGLRGLASRATPFMQKQLQEAKDLEKSLKSK